MQWPKKPIHIIVSFTPGGAPDTLARILAESWQKTLGVNVLVENRPGFGGNIGAILGNTSVLSAADVLNNFNAQRATYGL